MRYIYIEHLKYKYPLSNVLALDDISLTINKGEFIGIVGANNAGKSTLCNALVGIVPHFYKGAYGGKVAIDNTIVKESTIEKITETVGIIFQNPFNQITGSKLTVYEEVAFGLENMGVARDEMIQKIDNALQVMGIEHLKDKNPFSLSGGQLQRLAIASVIAMAPDVIILDEPTSQLDPQGSTQVFEAVDYLKRQGKTIIMVEHKMEKLAEFSDKILLLDKGKVIDFATPEQIFSRADINQYGITIPIFTQVCQQLQKTTEAGTFPVTLTKTIKLLRREEK